MSGTLQSGSSQSVAGAVGTMACPICHGNLTEIEFNSVHVDTCPQGHGIWFDFGELESVEVSDTVDNIDEAFAGTFEKKSAKAQLEDGTVYHCPRDNGELARYEWNIGSGIVMDKCESCQGIWLDAGELEGYAQFVKRSAAFKPHDVDPDIQRKLDLVKNQVEVSQAESRQKIAGSIVDWDVWIFDDMIRGVMERFMH